MTDSDTVECEFCGDEYKTQGLATHQRFCDEKPCDEDASGRSALASEALERDGHTCVNCGSTDELTAHMVDSVEPDRLANRISLCLDCHDEFDELHPLTKRTKAFN